jgi:predicted DNA-binding transcriptional regulator YafY
MDASSFARYLGRMDRAELAEVLRVRPEVRVAPVPDGPEALAVRSLSKKVVALLAAAIDEQSDVRIDYVDGKGESSTRTITPIRWDGPFLLAWCHMREADRQFRVERIKSVSPVRP